MLRRLRTFARGASGMAAVEFALIAPIMMVLFFGLVELCNALNAHQKVTSVASTAADLTGQAKSVTAADLDDIFAASSAIMTPFSASDVSIVITSIGGSGQRNVGKVLWSVTNGHGVAHNVGDTIDIGNPAALDDSDIGLLPADCADGTQCSLILAEVSYTYRSSYAKIITGDLPMTDTFYTKPRRVIAVACDQCGG
jgi:Flp pilus assembly protein TadG